MSLNTNICELLQIKYPVFQGAMAWIAGGRLAGSVSNAGGLGIIGAGSADTDWLKREIEAARRITEKPFGVNLIIASPHIDSMVDMVIKEKVAVVTTGAGSPGKYIEGLKQAGVKVIPVVASVALARRLERLGADALIVEGMESGGHIGEMTTMSMVPMVVDAVKIPVIAAGGIADGRGVAAALALGASGVQIGTRFICAVECGVHPDYQQRVIKAKDRDTVVCGETTGHPVRAIHNRFTRHYLECEKKGMCREELEQLGSGRYPAAALRGEIDEGSVLAGQVCGLVNKIQPAGEIVEELVNETSDVLMRLRRFV